MSIEIQLNFQRNFIGRFCTSCGGGRFSIPAKPVPVRVCSPFRCSVSADFRAEPSRDRRNGLDSAGRIGENGNPQGGGVAQLGEHHVRNVGVEGSIPFSSTILSFRYEGWCPPKRRRGRI